MARKSLSKKIRFEIFKRDRFTCQYCGASAPDVVLNVDHVQPVAAGGSDDFSNLTTACFSCNNGKGARELGQSHLPSSTQPAILRAKREQLDMLLEWQRETDAAEAAAAHKLAARWRELAPGWVMSAECVRSKLTPMLRKYGATEVAKAMQSAASQYLKFDADQAKVTQESWLRAWDFVPRICGVNLRASKEPWLKDLYYFRGILRRRFGDRSPQETLDLMNSARQRGMSMAELHRRATSESSWYSWRSGLESWTVDSDLDAEERAS